jgi:molybdate transport system substrate-binding protein
MLAILALNRAGVWPGVQPKIVHGKDAGEVLEYLEKATAQAGLLYWSEAAFHPSVRVVGTFERPYSDPIRLSSAVTSRAKNLEGASAWQEWLGSKEAQVLVVQMGYKTE